MTTFTLSPRAHRAALRAALFTAHPDHGGTPAALQGALDALRAERATTTPAPSAQPPQAPRPARTQRAAWAAAERVPEPSTLALLVGIVRAVVRFYVVFALVVGGFGLAITCFNAWRAGG